MNTLSTSPATIIPPGLENSHLIRLKDKNLLETFQIRTVSKQIKQSSYSFLPKLQKEQMGNGTHINLQSIWTPKN